MESALEMATRSSSTDQLVKTGIVGNRGGIVLDRPAALNALTLPMIRDIHTALRDFQRDPAIDIITIESTRDGCFCAGGDIRSVREARLAGRHAEADSFFADEFDLNLEISLCPKPYVALIDGICMGGGLGLSVHGTHRVVSERLVMALPETAIGYFPDIGASYFLNALPPGETGLYIALTGERLSAQDALYCGLATAIVPHEAFADLSAALSRCVPSEVSKVIRKFSVQLEPGPIELNQAVIDRCFSAASIRDICARLEKDGGRFAAAALEKMRAASPASLRIALELLRAMRGRSLAYCLQTEYALAREVTRSADFAEGVRAMLVDKDRRPIWKDS